MPIRSLGARYMGCLDGWVKSCQCQNRCQTLAAITPQILYTERLCKYVSGSLRIFHHLRLSRTF